MKRVPCGDKLFTSKEEQCQEIHWWELQSILNEGRAAFSAFSRQEMSLNSIRKVTLLSPLIEGLFGGVNEEFSRVTFWATHPFIAWCATQQMSRWMTRSHSLLELSRNLLRPKLARTRKGVNTDRLSWEIFFKIASLSQERIWNSIFHHFERFLEASEGFSLPLSANEIHRPIILPRLNSNYS